jgi:hypothetical protein
MNIKEHPIGGWFRATKLGRAQLNEHIIIRSFVKAVMSTSLYRGFCGLVT